MADERDPNTLTGVPEFSDAEKAKARQWFKKAADTRQLRDYEYAIECYVTGLGFWPDAVEEALMPLRSLAVQRQQEGGKKPGMMDAMKRSTGGKDPKLAFLNAIWLLAKEPTSQNYAEAVLKNATKAGYIQAARFAAPIVYDLLKREKKPNLKSFRTFRDTLVESAERAATLGDEASTSYFYDLAVSSLDFLRARVPDNEEIRNEQRDLSSKLTISRGKYQEADSFRSSLRDGDKQKLLHDAERLKQGEDTFEALITAARKELAAAPTMPAKINALADVLLKRERKEEEDEAAALLMKAFTDSRNYSYKMRADEIRLKQLARQTRLMIEHARQTGAEEDQRNARLTAMEQLQEELAVYRERCENYPTDMRLKVKLGATLFRARQFEEAIPVLQQAQAEPRSRARCQLLMGRCFFEQGSFSQAREVITEALQHYEMTGDDTHKEMQYWLGRAYEAEGNKAEAVAVFGKLLRQDYNYADGDARRRMEQLK